MISVICPFFNEAEILEDSVIGLVAHLERIGEPWELVLVNDGSTDASPQLAERLAVRIPGVRVVGYPYNRGRGHALRFGLRRAAGELLFTTEVDGSWGDDIVARMYDALEEHPEADLVVASPHLAGGGYRNVPLHRVLLSRWGNAVIRMGHSFRISMNTGMTRGYRRAVIESMPLYEDGKEFHLEVLLKAVALNWRILEIPAILEWKTHKRDSTVVERRSSSKIVRTIGSHLLFSLCAAPIRYLLGLGAVAAAAAAACLAYAVWRFVAHEPYAYGLLGFVSFAVLSVVMVSLGVVSQQSRLVMRELWRLQSRLAAGPARDAGAESVAAPAPDPGQRR